MQALLLRKKVRYILGLIGLLLTTLAVQAQPVYKTPSGSKYHTAKCGMVKNVSTELTLAQAVESGLQPCKLCSPPVLTGIYNLPAKKANGQNLTVQCKGLTKKGTRCKHMTRIANGYCFQHNPD